MPKSILLKTSVRNLAKGEQDAYWLFVAKGKKKRIPAEAADEISLPVRPAGNREKTMSKKLKSSTPTLFTRDFILLFFMALCNNSYMAVFYCFEQWLGGMQVSPNWRGLLLSAMFAMVLIGRPVASIVLISRSKFIPIIVGICISSLAMLSYSQISGPNTVWLILGVRIIQGIALSVYSFCVTSVLVSCIPPGKSAQGFAVFSLATLLPYSIIPSIGESVLPLLHSEASLFALMACLGVPALIMAFLLAHKLRDHETHKKYHGHHHVSTPLKLLHGMTKSGLGLIFLACLCFSIETSLLINFLKGLSLENGTQPALFFLGYTLTMIVIRLVSGHMLDNLHRHRTVELCALLMGISVFLAAWGPTWAFVPLSITYGIGLGFLYPLLAATIYDRSTEKSRPINSNMMMMTFDASGMLGPLIGGAVIDAGFGYHGVFTTATGFVLCCGLCMILDRLIRNCRRKALAAAA